MSLTFYARGAVIMRIVGKNQQKYKSLELTAKDFTVCFSGITFFALFLKNSALVSEYIKSGLSLCVSVVIPAIFPYMVLSAFLINVGFERLTSGRVGRIFGNFFRIPSNASAAIILGLLCGFPVGAVAAYKLYDKGGVDKDTLIRVLYLSSVASPAFLISGVGEGIWKSKMVGVALYIIQIVAMLIVGLLTRGFYEKGDGRGTSVGNRQKSISIASAISDSVSSSSVSMLKVCGFVLFFISVGGVISASAEKLLLFSDIKAYAFGFLEMSSGVREIAVSAPVNIAFPVTALFVGWSGLSVHFQIIAVGGDIRIGFFRYFAAKTAMSALSFLLAFIYLKIFPFEQISSQAFSPVFVNKGYSLFTLALVFIGSVKSLRKRA